MLNVWPDEKIKAVLAYAQGSVKFPGGGVVEAGKRGLRAGDCLAYGKATSNGIYFVVAKYTEVRTAATNDDIAVDDAHPFELGDVVVVGTDTGKTITAINYETNVITVSGGNFAHVVDDHVFVASTGTTRGRISLAVAVASMPMFDKYSGRSGNKSGLVSNVEFDTPYGDAYIMGTFHASVLHNGNFTGTDLHTDMGGEYQSGNNTYVVSKVPSNYA